MGLHKLIVFFLISALSFSLLAEEENKVVVVVVEKQDKKLPENVDPILASTINGLSTVQKSAEETGKLNCDCIQEKGPYTSLVLGNGRGSEGGSMQWKAFSLRLGKFINEKTRVDFVHINEGHPLNNHRDGFAIAASYDIPLSKNLQMELSAGPYFSMNTTVIDGIEKDDKHLGLLSTVAALYSLDRISPGLHLRAEYNHVYMPGGITTDSLLVGVGKVFDAKKSEKKTNDDKGMEVNLIGNHFKTNHGNTDAANGMQIEAKKEFSKHGAVSVGYLHEGKDVLVDRQGLMSQVWYVQPLSDKVSISAGGGPYFANNKLDEKDNGLNAIISFEIKKEVSKTYSIFIRANRIADFSGSNDRDMVGLGVAAKF